MKPHNLKEISSNRFRYENSGRAQMMAEPLSFDMKDEWVWKANKGWKIVGWNPNPQWQGKEHRAGVLYENEDGTEEAWFHWEEEHLHQIKN